MGPPNERLVLPGATRGTKADKHGNAPQGLAKPNSGRKVAMSQDQQFFGGDAGAQIAALRDYVRHHYKD